MRVRSVDDTRTEAVDTGPSTRAARRRRGEWGVVLAISLGGACGALGRWGVSLALPHAPGSFPWSTVLINATGCLLLGALFGLLLEVANPHRLVRPFVGTGVCGGYTTFSTFAVDVQRMLHAHRPGLALAYLAVTWVLAMIAVTAGVLAARSALRRRRLVRRGRRFAGATEGGR